VFSVAVDRDPGKRKAYLDQACAGDTNLCAEVDQLLAGDEEASEENFLEATVLRPPNQSMQFMSTASCTGT
jgi:hypothetical protein